MKHCEPNLLWTPEAFPGPNLRFKPNLGPRLYQGNYYCEPFFKQQKKSLSLFWHSLSHSLNFYTTLCFRVQWILYTIVLIYYYDNIFILV